MFGHHKQKRENKKLKEEKNVFNQQKIDYEKNAPQREKEASDAQDKLVQEKLNKSKEDRKGSYAEGKARAEELFSRNPDGLDPKERQAMQYEANKSIQRATQSANRKLLGDQASHGIVGKGGVGYAQQRDLQRMSQEAQGAVDRDLTKLDKNLALKKLAAAFNIEQGEASQDQLDRQLAIDELQLQGEKKKQKKYEDQINTLFNRL